MAERTASIPYNGTPTVQAGGGGGTMFGVRASPNDFGAQTGAAMQDLGKEFARFDGMINETVANTAEIDYMRASGELTSKYQSMKGLAAQAAFPQYQKDLLELRQKLTKDMPVKASNAFNSVVQRQEISLLNSGREYGLKQVQAANVDSNNALSQLAISQTADPAVAADDMAFGERMGTIRYSVDAMMDAQGYSAHASRDEAGNLVFNDTPEGQKGKAVYQAELEQRIAMAWENRLKTVANTNVMTAYKMLQDNRKDIPGTVQVQMDAYLQPKVKDYTTRIIADDAQTELDNGYKENVLTPSSPVDTILKNEIAADGNISVHSDGDGQAIGGINSQAYPAQFNEAKAILEKDGQEAARKYITNFYDKEVVQGRGISALPKNVQTIVADGLVNHWSGFQKDLLDAAKAGASPQELIDMRRKEYMRLAAADPEKYGKSLEGWNNRLDKLENSQGIATDGIYPSRADYYRKNYDAIIEKYRKKAEIEYPDDPSYADMAAARVTQRMDNVISAQEREIKANRNLLVKAINGGFGEKNIPTSVEQMANMSPEIKAAWEWVQVNDAKLAETIENKIITANSKETDKDVKEGGQKFYDFYKRAILPPGDPKRPTPLEVMQSVGEGLTLKGQKEILGVLDAKNEGNERYINNAVNYMKGLIIGAVGAEDKGEVQEKLARMTFEVRNQVAVGLANGKTIEQLTDPDSKDFAGLAAKSLIPSTEETAQQVLETLREPMEYTPTFLDMFRIRLPEAEKIDFTKRFDEFVQLGQINEKNAWYILRDLVASDEMEEEEAKNILRKYKFKKYTGNF